MEEKEKEKFLLPEPEAFTGEIGEETEVEMFICAHCGKMHPISERKTVYTYGGSGCTQKVAEDWCEDCAEADAAECRDCGELHPTSSMYWIDADEEYVCYHCFLEDYEECDHCGRIFRIDDLRDVETAQRTERWCEDCVDEDASECEDCGKLCATIDMMGVGDNTEHLVCGSCYDDYDECYHCGGRYRRDDMTYIEGHGYICDDCRVDYTSECSECGDIIDDDDSYYDEDEDRTYCECCYDNRHRTRVRSYHCGPRLMLFGKYDGAFKGLGVELEVDQGTGPDPCIEELEELHETDELYYEHDGSLGYEGFEIITQPHTEEAFYSIDWQGIMETCIRHGYKSHDAGTCGLHVHVSREMFGDFEEQQDMNISKVVAFYERNWEDMLKLSRRTEATANRWAQRYSTKNLSRDEIADVVKNSKTWGHGARYYAINLTNSHTVEFRLCRGTLNLDSFMAWIDLTLRMVDASREIEWSDIDDVSKWFANIKTGTLGYIRQRGAFKCLYEQETIREAI